MKKLTSQKKIFFLALLLIFLLGLILRILPTRDNNFYFTMDQGNDAVHVREILERKEILLLGPETGLKGLYAGPLWYYFIAIGYALFHGHPFGSVFMLILLNLSLIWILMWKVGKELSLLWAVIVGIALQTSWWLYDTSRYGFNPFPLVFLSFMMIFALIDFLRGKDKSYILAAIPIGLAYNTEIAGSIAFTLFYLLVGLWAIFKKHTSWKLILTGILVIGLFLMPLFINELTSGFSQTHTLIKEFENPAGVFSEQLFHVITPRFSKIISRSSLRQIPEIGILIFTLLVVLVSRKWATKRKINLFIKYFVLLTLILLATSWLWFSSNKGWQSWQTVYLSPLIFVSFLLLLFELKIFIALPLLTISLISHFLIFQDRYAQYYKPADDASTLKNEISAIDWVYKQAEGKGFYVYNYLPSVYDYPYQYLFWWYGRGKYGYLPCEYSTYPNTADLFVPGLKYYQEPKRECSNLRFLIIEPDKNREIQNIWLNGVRKDTILLEEDKIGDISVEKRQINK